MEKIMTRRERLMRTLRGENVDRPPVNFYEVGGFAVDPTNPDPFNIYNSPSWKPLLELTEKKTDITRMRVPRMVNRPEYRYDEFIISKVHVENGSRYAEILINTGGRTLKQVTRRDPDVDTVWVIEHMLKDEDDVKAYLQLPDDVWAQDVDVAGFFEEEKRTGDAGIVMVEISDPLCIAAGLFSMDTYTIIAYSQPELFHKLLEKVSRLQMAIAEVVSAAFPGRLWRICGAEYATEPYLPPKLFEEYVVRYTGPIVGAIKKHGGFARLHCHGRIKNVLPYMVKMGVDAIDPIEPAPQGDVTLEYVRREYGKDMVLFGNLEVSDIENMEPHAFEAVVRRSIGEGTSGQGRGFVLMPSAAPYGRVITETAMRNYETMVRLVESCCV